MCCTRDSLIFDVGAHVGEDTEFYLKLGYQVVAIEPNPELVKILKNRFSEEVISGRLTVLPVAIGRYNQDVVFFANQTLSVWGTIHPDWAERNRLMGAESLEIRVRSMPLRDVISQYGCPDYLKIDIEGMDLVCLDGLRETKCRPDFVSLESTKVSWRGLLQEFEILDSLGYNRFQVVRQGANDTSSGLFRNLDGSVSSHQFTSDSSGPFGPHLDGPWLTKRQAINRYRKIFVLYRTIGSLGQETHAHRVLKRTPGAGRLKLGTAGWYDTHARIDK